MEKATKMRMVKYEVLRLYEAGLRQTEIAKVLDLSRQRVSQILRASKKLDK